MMILQMKVRLSNDHYICVSACLISPQSLNESASPCLPGPAPRPPPLVTSRWVAVIDHHLHRRLLTSQHRGPQLTDIHNSLCISVVTNYMN